MMFLNPMLAAVGLACVAVPVLIHILMRRRRRPVAWGAMRFLLEAYRRQRRRMNLEQLLLLFSRCLLVALLALALGKPILGAAGALSAAGPRTVYILFDNSVATGPGSDVSGSAGEIEELRAMALRSIGGLDRARGDRVGLILLAAPAENAVLPASSELSAVSEMIKQVRPSASRADLPGALIQLREELTRKDNADSSAWVVVLSPFRAGSADTRTSVQSLGLPAGRVAFIVSEPKEKPVGNVSITGLDPVRSVMLAGEEPGSSTSVTVSLTRSGPLDAETSIVSIYAGAAREVSTTQGAAASISVAWSAGQSYAQALAGFGSPRPARPGDPVVLTATINPDALSADNRFVRPVETRERLDVVIITPGDVGVRGEIANYRAADWFALALSPSADLSFRRRQAGEIRISTVDPEQGIAPSTGTQRASRGAGILREADAVIVPRPDLLDPAAWKAIRESNDRGAMVLVCPPAGPEVHTWTDTFINTMGLPWQVSRESRKLATPLSISGERPPTSGTDLLGVIAPELTALVGGVTVSRMLDARGTQGGLEEILRLSDGTPILIAAAFGESVGETPSETGNTRGTLLYLAAAPDVEWTNLPATPFMVPLMQELVRQGVGLAVGSRAAVAGVPPKLPRGATELVPAEGQGQSVIPISASGVPQIPIRDAGLWTMRSSGGSTIGAVAFNADTAGCDTTPLTKEQVARWLSPAASNFTWLKAGDPAAAPGGVADSVEHRLSRKQETPPISVPLLIAAAIVAAVELILARIFSHATREETLGEQRRSRGAA